MNDVEKKLLKSIGAVMKGFSRIQGESLREHPDLLEKYDGDNSELVYHIHALQNWVLSNEAARQYPGQFRPFGCSNKKDV